MSQASLAKASGLSQGAISSYENRTRHATTGIIQLAKALGVNPVWLNTGKGSMEPALELDVAVVSELRDTEGRAIPIRWPFQRIAPSEYWVLNNTQRAIVEQTVSALIKALRETDDEISE